jgi:hypothetical protein
MGFLQPITLQGFLGTKRTIGSITVQCILSENTNDTLTITKQPVQQGASITDHSYLEPTVLDMKLLQQNNNLITGITGAFSGNGLAAVYQTFLALQASRVPFTVTTPKRVYQSMLMGVLRLTTEKTTENILSIDVTLQQVILVNVGTAQISVANQANRQVTQATQNLGNESAAYKISQAFKGVP